VEVGGRVGLSNERRELTAVAAVGNEGSADIQSYPFERGQQARPIEYEIV
jgi:hypothetical protein